MTKRLKAIRYIIVGILGTIIHLSILVFLVEILSFKPVIASSTAFTVVVLVSYYLNYFWTFKSNSKYLKSLPRYILVCCFGFTLNALIMFFTVEVLHFWYLTGQVVAAFLIPISNFMLNLKWTFSS